MALTPIIVELRCNYHTQSGMFDAGAFEGNQPRSGEGNSFVRKGFEDVIALYQKLRREYPADVAITVRFVAID